MLICRCTHFDTSHANGGGACYAGDCMCGGFREDIQASNAARSSSEDETRRESNGYEDSKG